MSSTMYKPHKVNDVRWIAIRKAQYHYDLLQLTHFRIPKQVGMWIGRCIYGSSADLKIIKWVEPTLQDLG
ncbi:hypothetical protein SOVF_126380, partial [Spinacia oleracea]